MKTLRVTICIVLIVGVLAMSLSVFADDEEIATIDDTGEEIVVTGDPAVDVTLYYIWYALRSWGINLSLDEIYEYSETAGEWLWLQIQEWLATIPSVSSYNYLISKWQVAFNQYGIFYGNQNFLQDMQDFADWLVLKFALASNTEHLITAGFKYVTADNGVKYYAAPYDTLLINLGTPVVTLSKYVDSDDSVYFENGRFYLRGQSIISGNGLRYFYTYEKQLDGTYRQVHSHGSNWRYANADEFVARLFYFPGGLDKDGISRQEGVYMFTDQRYSEGNEVGLTDYIWSINLTNYGSDTEFKIVVTDLEVPDESGTVSIEIDGDIPYYIEITWPEKISIDNLPAVITQRNIPDIGNDEENPGFSVPWQAINGLIQYVAAPAGAIMALVNEAPVEGVIMLYALIGGMIIFGMIRIMREH